MKKLFKFLGIGILFTIPVILLSCKDQFNEKESNPTPISISKNTKIDDGMMVFESENSFKNFRTEIDKKTDKELLEFTKKNGFDSHLDAVQRIEYTYKHQSASSRLSNEQMIQFKERVKDHYFASILNSNRELKIGSNIYRANNDYVFVYKKGQESEIDNFYTDLKLGNVSIPDDKKAHTFKNINVAKVFHENFTLQEAKTTGKSKNARLQSDNCITYAPNDGNKRVNGSVWTSWWLFYNSGGIATECEEYTGGLFGWFPAWRDYDSDRVFVWGHNMKLPLRLFGEVICCNEFCDDVFQEYFNDDEVSPVIKWIVPFPSTYLSWYTAEVRCGANIPGSNAGYWCDFTCFNP
jgi:hypothetical protein